MTLVQEGNVEMLKINEQMWLHVMKTITYRRYYNKNIERNLEGDTSDLTHVRSCHSDHLG